MITGKTIEKILSGRLFLTYCAGIAFMYAVVKKILSPEAMAGIITMVFTLYFTRADRTNGDTNLLYFTRADRTNGDTNLKFNEFKKATNSIDTEKIVDLIESWGKKYFGHKYKDYLDEVRRLLASVVQKIGELINGNA